jgi:RNA polymerase sigma factor (sigma-70 family)
MMARSGNAGAFETIVDRYQGRLLGFCRQMLGSTEDAEDVLQEVFVNAYRAMLADSREINLRPWLYRIARNRCLNHLRKPTADAQESMDAVPLVEAASTAEKVHNREEFRQLLTDVGKLPETQRTALMLREMDAMSYEEIAQAMETSVPSIKSLLVRARISLAEASQARQLTCGEVQLELAEAAEGLRKVSGPARRHVRDCDQCADFRSVIRSNEKVLAAIYPAGPLLLLKSFILSKLGIGGAGGTATGGVGAGATASAGSAGAVSSMGAAISSGGAASGIGAVGGAIGTKAVAGVVTAAVITAGAVEVKDQVVPTPVPKSASASRVVTRQPLAVNKRVPAKQAAERETPAKPATVESGTAPTATTTPATETTPTTPTTETAQSTPTADGQSVGAPASGVTAAKPQGGAGVPNGGEIVVVTVAGSPSSPPAEAAAPPPAESAPPPSPPRPSEPAEESPPPPPPLSGEESVE